MRGTLAAKGLDEAVARLGRQRQTSSSRALTSLQVAAVRTGRDIALRSCGLLARAGRG
jgi:hypothetical protein